MLAARPLPLAPKQAQRLRDAYYTPSGLASFSGNLNELSKKTQLSKEKVSRWLNEQLPYNLHKTAKKTYPTRKYMVRTIDEQWQADLVDMQTYERLNKGYRFILTVIDVFSRYAWAKPIKRKTGTNVAEALQSIFEEGRTPHYLQTDQGLEFYNTPVKSLLEHYNIELFSVYSQHKAALVERFNRTLKGKMHRAFTHFGNYKWLHILDDLVDSYNKTQHTSIGCAPKDVTKENASEIWVRQYADVKKPKRIPKFKINDKVRISKQRNVFSRGFHPNWSEEIFTIHSINTKYVPITYKLRDYKNEIIKGSFYKQELQRADDDPLHRIENVIRTRGNGQKKEALVKWLGYPQTSWVKYINLQKMTDI